MGFGGGCGLCSEGAGSCMARGAIVKVKGEVQGVLGWLRPLQWGCGLCGEGVGSRIAQGAILKVKGGV